MKKLFQTILLALALPVGMAAQGWPQNYEGVMMQAFYWDSYTDTQWTELESQSDELSEYFDLLWVPQSGYCNTTKNQMGYLPVWWFNHLSCFGTEAELRSMIQTFKRKGTGIIEDVVINHRNGNTNWCDFPTETWNGHTMSWTLADICQGDDGGKTERNGYQITGNKDTGDDFDGGRDIDHTSKNAQENIKLYLDFLLNDLGYAGFRYDMVKGYAPEYTSMYNQSAKPGFSVGEYWDNTIKIKAWINGTKDNSGTIQSAAFDFPLKYNIYDAFKSGGTWSALNNACLTLEQGFSRYSVTFVDNHDTYRPGSQGSSPLYANIEAANAFLLSMPGTPCVFLPHWQQYKTAIKKQIIARKACGVSNQSVIEVAKAETNGYVLRVKGSKGSLLLLLGTPSDYDLTGFKLATEGSKYKMYVSQSVDVSAIDNVKDEDSVAIPSFCQPETDKYCAYFVAPSTWKDPVSCWCWNDKKNFTGGTWPGVQCTFVGMDSNGQKVYKWTGPAIDGSSDAPTGIIFSYNNGGTQTTDLDFVQNGYYTTGGAKGVVTTSIKLLEADEAPAETRVYTIDGRLVRTAATMGAAMMGLNAGIYVVNHRKVVVK